MASSDDGNEWEKAITAEYERRSKSLNNGSENEFPLIASSIFKEEILAAVDSILNGQLTMSTEVREFEEMFAKQVGAPFAIMCNSGSSANLLALAALTNHLRTDRLSPGDEVLIPAVCWSTSLWPIIQMGLVPIFVDVDPVTLNIDLKDLDLKDKLFALVRSRERHTSQ